MNNRYYLLIGQIAYVRPVCGGGVVEGGVSQLQILRDFGLSPLAAFGQVAGRGHALVRGLPLPRFRFHFIDDPHLAQRILLSKDFQHDPMVYEQLRPITGQQGMVQLTGQESKDLRATLRPLLVHEGMEVLESIVADELARLFAAWDRGGAQKVTEAIYQLTWRVNYRYLCGDDRLQYSDELFEAFRVIGRICGARMRRLQPLPRWIPTKENRELTKARETAERLLSEVMATQNGDRVSVLSLLPKGSLAFDQLTTLMWAGHETTACGIITSLHYLAADAALQSSIAGDRKLSTRVFKEAIRLHPPAYMLVRKVRESTEVNGVSFGRGDHVVISLFNMQRRPDLFPEPEKFDPGRFEGKANPLGYLPFGLGGKRCFGEPISYFEASKVLSELTSRYEFKPAGTPLTFATDVTLVPRADYALKVERRT